MCLTCFGKQKTFCRGCYEGSSLAWEWTADAFRADEAQREAVRWFAEGIERERARTGPLIDRFAGTEKEREAHKAALRVVELRMQGKHDRSRQDLEK